MYTIMYVFSAPALLDESLHCGERQVDLWDGQLRDERRLPDPVDEQAAEGHRHEQKSGKWTAMYL